jgi:hypothetical protein
VSRDLDNWVFEGEVLAQADVSFWYAATSGSNVFFIRQESVDGAMWLGQARIQQP